MISRPRVAIVGAGIGGLTAALALTRAGLPCRVYEQAGRLGEIGAGIQIAPNAGRLLHRLGLGDTVRTHAVTPGAIEFRGWDTDEVVDATTLDGDFTTRFGVPYYTLHRPDLHGALLDALPEGTVTLGARCVGVEQRPGDVVPLLEDGPAEPADVVVGADGIRSVIRESMVDDHPRFSGHVIFRGLVPGERLPHLLSKPKIILWRGPTQHVVCYPVAAGRLINVAATAPATDGTESWTEPGSVPELLATYTGWHDTVLEILAAQSSVTRWALHDRDPITEWGTGRVTLLGDAAHPMLPFAAQGANQAIEDAAALATFLRDATPDTVPHALRRYEQVRRDRTAEVQRRSRRDVAPPDQEWLYGYEAG